MMSKNVVFIERQPTGFVSIEKVFRQIQTNLSSDKFTTAFQQLPFGNDLWGIIKNLVFFKRIPADLYHITGHIHYIALRLPKSKTALTIHDLGFMDRRTGLKKYVIKKLFLDWPIKRVEHITAISQKTKDEIIALTNCSSEKILVIHNPLTINDEHPAKKKLDKNYPIILQIGSSPNKNVVNLINALSGLRCKLVIVGRPDEEQKYLLNENKIDHEIKFDLEHSEIIDEYRKADIVTFCSTYEGFGLPIIEAQAMQKPVVTSNLSPMTEVAGNAAVFVNPYDVENIREGILQIVEDETLRNDLIKKGNENIKRFDSLAIGKVYEDYYLSIFSSQTQS